MNQPELPLVNCFRPPPPGESEPAEALKIKIADLAIVNLGNQIGVGLDEIKVVSIESVVWPDSSLGCPQRGQMYTQSVVPGLRIRLSTGTSQYVYNTDLSGVVILCIQGDSIGS